jgi:hypothetical protein
VSNYNVFLRCKLYSVLHNIAEINADVTGIVQESESVSLLLYDINVRTSVREHFTSEEHLG